jgi:hypothetical protein
MKTKARKSENVRKLDDGWLWIKIAECAAELMKRKRKYDSPALQTAGEYGAKAIQARLTIRVEHDEISGGPCVFVENNTSNDDDMVAERALVSISKAHFQHIVKNHKKENKILANALGKAKFKLLVKASNRIHDRGGLTRFFHEQPAAKCRQFAGFTK